MDPKNSLQFIEQENPIKSLWLLSKREYSQDWVFINTLFWLEMCPFM